MTPAEIVASLAPVGAGLLVVFGAEVACTLVDFVLTWLRRMVQDDVH